MFGVDVSRLKAAVSGWINRIACVVSCMVILDKSIATLPDELELKTGILVERIGGEEPKNMRMNTKNRSQLSRHV